MPLFFYEERLKMEPYMSQFFRDIFKLVLALLMTGIYGASVYAGDCAHVEYDPALDGWCAGQITAGDRRPAADAATGANSGTSSSKWADTDIDQQEAEDRATAQAFIEMFNLNRPKTSSIPPGPEVDRNDSTVDRGEVAEEVADILSGDEVEVGRPTRGER
jgi:hypothetical protein